MQRRRASSEIHELIRERLTDSAIRYTTGRQRVVAAIQMSSGPRRASELASRHTDSLPLSSLYRTLSLLEGHGVLKKNHGSDGVARYELAEWLTGHHHHVVCMSCNAMEDIDVLEGDETTLHKIVSSLAETANFRVLDHVLEVEGVCQNCDMS